MKLALANHKDTIAGLGRQNGVRRFDMFGSATCPDFDAEKSDFDFVNCSQLGSNTGGVLTVVSPDV